MASCYWLLMVILSIQVINSHQKRQTTSFHKHDKYIQASNRATVGCVTAKQAETMSEEIAQMLRTAKLVEISTQLFDSVTTVPIIEACKKSHPSSLDYETKLGAKQQQILAKATDIEEQIRQANERKEKQDELADKVLIIWKKVQRVAQQHQKILNSLDIFAKDSVLQKAAQIELELNNDTIEADWTLDSIKEALLDELSDAKEIQSILGEPILDTMETVLNRIMDYFAISQMFTSLRSTKLGDPLMNDGIYSTYYGYSQVASSKGIRKAVNMRYGTMITGYDEVTEYAAKVNQTLGDIKEGIDKLQTVSDIMSCNERSRIGREVLASLQTVISDLDSTVLPEASNYLQAVEKHGSGYMLPILTEREFTSGLASFMFTTLPEIGKKTPTQREAFLQIGKYASEARIELTTVTKAYSYLTRMFPYIETIAHSNRCYTKTFVAIGKFIQKCADGEGTFDEIYYGVMNDLKMNRFKCHRKTGLRFPLKIQVEGIVRRAAEKRGFSFDCTKNKQQDQPTAAFAYYDETGDDDEVREIMSPTQRYMVCDLRSKSKTKSQISQLMLIDQPAVESVRCKA